MTRRLSRGTPAILSVKEQELLVRSAEQDPLMKRAIEIFTGRDWDTLTFGQRLTAIGQEMEKSRGAAYMVQAMSARNDLQKVVDDADDTVSISEQLERTANELAVAREKLSTAEQRLDDLTHAAASLPPRSNS